MRDEYDVIIIGAGPAGLSCAIELQQTQKTVLLIEKNKEIGPKVCAGGLTTKIENLGFSLEDLADVLFSFIKINVAGKTKIVSSDKPFIATIDRSKLGRMLLKKLSGKIEIITDSEVDKIDDNFIETRGQKIKYKYLVGADGSNSIVRRFLGLKNKKFLIALQYIIPQNFKHLELFFDGFLFGSGYAWVFPHKSYTSIGCVCDGKFAKGFELVNNFKKWLKNKNIETKEAKLQVGVINFDYQGFDFGNKFLVGEAAGFASGLTGEGIYFGMASGQEIAKKIANHSYQSREILKMLKIKHAHERTIRFMLLLNKSLLNLCFRLLLLLFSSKWFTKKSIKFI